MPKKIVQVPIDEDLLEALDSLARQYRRSRAEVIRAACQRYLRREEDRRLDEVYEDGYKRVPEEPAIGVAQAELAGQVLPQESW